MGIQYRSVTVSKSLVQAPLSEASGTLSPGLVPTEAAGEEFLQLAGQHTGRLVSRTPLPEFLLWHQMTLVTRLRHSTRVRVEKVAGCPNG